jgi:hypothetical protein
MQHIDPGETETVTKVGVNEEPTFRAATISQKVSGMTVRILAKEDNTVVHGSSIQFASKKVKQIEEEDGGAAASSPVSEERVPHKLFKEEPSEPIKTIGLGPLEVLKNFVDNAYKAHESRLKGLDSEQKISFFLGGLGAAGFILGFAALLKVLIH